MGKTSDHVPIAARVEVRTCAPTQQERTRRTPWQPRDQESYWQEVRQALADTQHISLRTMAAAITTATQCTEQRWTTEEAGLQATRRELREVRRLRREAGTADEQRRISHILWEMLLRFRDIRNAIHDAASLQRHSLGRLGKKLRSMRREVLPTMLLDGSNNEVGRNKWGELFRDWWTARWSPQGATREREDRHEYPLTVSDAGVADALGKVAGKATAPGPDGVT